MYHLTKARGGRIFSKFEKTERKLSLYDSFECRTDIIKKLFNEFGEFSFIETNGNNLNKHCIV